MAYENEREPSAQPKYNCLLFDIDDTLYPLTSGLSAQVAKNIGEYMLQKLNIEKSKVPDLCVLLYKNYGTTMAGLRAIGHNIDYDDFHSFVHGRLPYELLKPDTVLRNILLSLPIRKLVFTNADERHAARVLKRLGVEDCFERVISFETLNPTDKNKPSSDRDEYSKSEIFDVLSHPECESALPQPPIVVCKPQESAFQQVFRMTGIDPTRTLFFDDSLRNIQSGKRTGLHTVMVGTSQRAAGADYALESIHNIREALPELWEGNEKSENKHPGNIGIETSVKG